MILLQCNYIRAISKLGMKLENWVFTSNFRQFNWPFVSCLTLKQQQRPALHLNDSWALTILGDILYACP